MENTWNVENTRKLFDSVYAANRNGESLAKTFEVAAKQFNVSAGSVRNYYYSQAKLFKMMPALAKEMGIEIIESRAKPFVPFDESESRKLVENAIIGKAEGKSVRSTIARMARGDEKIALRYQNKYRSVLAHHKNMVNDIMSELSKKGVRYYNPYTRVVVSDKSGGTLVSVLEKIDGLTSDEKEMLLRKMLS